MIKFSAWNIDAIGSPLGRQYDNLTRSLDIVGNIPEGWTWDLLVQAGKNLDIIRLNQGENSLSVMLTSEMLALAGYYVLQLRATQGEKVRHTNVLRVYVPESLSGDGHWPEVPTEFTQLEQRVQGLAQSAQDAAEQAENARDKYPKIIGGNWQVYDPETGEYVDTGVYAGGDAPYIGENGNWFVGSVDTGVRAQGEPGAPGKTPERGVDYWTEDDKQEIISEVLEQVPSGSEIDDTAVSYEKTWSSKNIVEKLAPAFEASGPVVTCSPVEGYPLHVVSQIVPLQEGSGDPSPENVRPISGWDAASLWAGGGNLAQNPESGAYKRATMTKVDDPTKARIPNIIPLFTSLYLMCNSSYYFLPQHFHNGVFVDGYAWTNAIVIDPKIKNSNQLAITIRRADKAEITEEDLQNIKLMCWFGDEVIWDSYVPHKDGSRFITLPFGQTVYGGTLDWTTGVLTVTHVEIASYAGEPLPGAWISDRDVYSQGATPTTGAQVVYELSDPITIQLTPQEILALSGTNTLYTDTGDTAVSGRADPNTIIQQLAARIAALEGAATNL